MYFKLVTNIYTSGAIIILYSYIIHLKLYKHILGKHTTSAKERMVLSVTIILLRKRKN